jgi:hypothetical protein
VWALDLAMGVWTRVECTGTAPHIRIGSSAAVVADKWLFHAGQRLAPAAGAANATYMFDFSSARWGADDAQLAALCGRCKRIAAAAARHQEHHRAALPWHGEHAVVQRAIFRSLCITAAVAWRVAARIKNGPAVHDKVWSVNALAGAYQHVCLV